MTGTAKKKSGFAVEKIIRPAAKGEERLPTQIGLPLLAKLLGISLVAAREHADKGIPVAGIPGSSSLSTALQVERNVHEQGRVGFCGHRSSDYSIFSARREGV
jgi:16S rRNA C1402 (ribose-2'-O) methylase RsmI